MPKFSIQFHVFSNDGFTTKVYRNEAIIGGVKSAFGKKDLLAAFRFIKSCMIGFNKGERGIRYGRNHEQIAKEKKQIKKRPAKETVKNQDPRKIRAAIKKSFQG